MPAKSKLAKAKTKELLYSKNDYVVVWDENEEDNFLIAQLLDDVEENSDEIKAQFYQRVKKNHFKEEESSDTVRAKYIAQLLPETSLTITGGQEKSSKADAKETKKTRSKKVVEAKVPKEITIQQKQYNAIKASIKKFTVIASEDEDNEESENEEDAVTEKQSKEASAKSKKIIGAKSQSSKPQAKSARRKKSVENEDVNEEIEESIKGKKATKSIAKKVVVMPTVYKRGKWNPNVEIIELNNQLESESLVPNFGCSVKNSNREIIRAAKIGSKKLLEKIVSSNYKISRLTERWGPDNRMTALKLIIDSGDKELLITFLDLLTDTKNKIRYGSDNEVSLKRIDTGYNDKYAYGVATRKVNVSRGGRQGNNAFVEEMVQWGNYLDDEHIEYLLGSTNTSTETLKTVISYFPNLENKIISKVGVPIRVGNYKLSSWIIDRAEKNGGYGFSEFYSKALTAKNVKDLGDMKKMNATKKAFGAGNFSPIHCACINPNQEIIKHVLSLNPEFLNLDEQMRKPVHYAAVCESVGPLKYL